MIAFVKGKIEEKFAGSVVVDVNGVGYEILVADQDYDAAELNTETKFYTYHAVRENSEELYGFTTLAAKRLFEMLITVQGVGPKAGLAIMSLDKTENVRNALANADSKFVGQAKGVGKKTAEKVIIDLSDKVGAPKIYNINLRGNLPQNDDALDALIALGYSLAEANDMLKDIDLTLPVEEKIKKALKN